MRMKLRSLSTLLIIISCNAALPVGTASAQSSELFVCLYYAPVEKTISYMHDVYQSVAHTTDGGATWKGMGWLISLVNDIHIDGTTGKYYLAADYGVLVSSDQGVTWTQVTGRLEGSAFRIVEHNSALWIATPNGPFVSTDNGTRWEKRIQGLPPLNGVYCADIAESGGTLFIATADGIFRSTGNGTAWKPSGLQGVALDGIAVNNAAPAEMCVYNASLGVWLSHDGGATWTNTSEGMYSKKIQTVAYHPTNPSILYAGFEDFPISKSTDAGKTWTTVNKGMTNNNVTAIAVDPGDANTIYAGTENGTWISKDGGSTWKPFTLRFGYVRRIKFAGGSK